MTRNELLSMYRQYPAALAEEVTQIFGTLEDETQRAEHNFCVRRIHRLTQFKSAQAQKRLWRNIARVIIHTVANQGDQDGDEENREEENR
ncbi:MAG: hypothetical protein GWN87_28525 [Desulfuromonadales bacterium]|nr:hypothetical protein [Desulfuromonadales bacterium]